MGKTGKSCAYVYNTKCWNPQPQVLQQISTPPIFTKFFNPAQVSVNTQFTLTFQIDNSTNAVAAKNVSFTDPLPSGLTAVSASSPQCGGTVDISDASIINFSGGTVVAGTVCEIVVTMAGVSRAGAYNNTTSSLTSSLGTSAAATASLEVISPIPQRRKK